MKIIVKKFINATKSFPLAFEENFDSQYDTEDIQNAVFYESQEQAEEELSRFDSPEKRMILPITITYEF